MIKYSFRLDLDEETMADIMAMAEHAGRPGNRVAGLCALIAEWRRLKAEHEARADLAVAALGYNEWAMQVAQHDEYCDALERRAEAEGR